jgi:hypothetical protein
VWLRSKLRQPGRGAAIEDGHFATFHGDVGVVDAGQREGRQQVLDHAHRAGPVGRRALQGGGEVAIDDVIDGGGYAVEAYAMARRGRGDAGAAGGGPSAGRGRFDQSQSRGWRAGGVRF